MDTLLPHLQPDTSSRVNPCSLLHTPGCRPNTTDLLCRYASYCANIARTYFVDPNPQQESEYAALLAAQQAAVAALVEGAPMSAAYKAVVKTLQVCHRGKRGGAGRGKAHAV